MQTMIELRQHRRLHNSELLYKLQRVHKAEYRDITASARLASLQP